MAEHRKPPGLDGEEPHEPHLDEVAEAPAAAREPAEPARPGDATDAERAEAAGFARALGGRAVTSDEHAADLAAALSIRAAFGGAAPLGELRARGLLREALVVVRRNAEAGARASMPATPRSAEALPARRGARARLAAAGWMALGAVAIALLLPSLRPRLAPLPERLVSRSAGSLVPGPFPASQTAADRLDLVTTDRLIALRDLRVRTAAGRRR